MDAMDQKQALLFQSLLKSDVPLTSHQLALHIGISIRTVKSYIVEINKQLKPYDYHIASKPHEGYRLIQGEQGDQEGIQKLYHHNMDFESIPKYNYERIHYIIKKLLVVDYSIKLADLMDEIYVSRSTLTQDLKEVRKLLEKFRLQVVSRANYGMHIEGSEMDKRLCIAEYFFHSQQKMKYAIETKNVFHQGKSREQYDHMQTYVKEICQRYHCILSDFSINNLVIHISVAMCRCTLYNYVSVQEESYLACKDTIEFKAATALVKRLEQEYHCMLPIGEVVYYAMHLQSKRIVNEIHVPFLEKQDVESCIKDILKEIKNNFELDLNKDQELYQYLYFHIPQMVRRLRNHMVIRNPLAHDNIRRYLFAAKVTHTAYTRISNRYDVVFDINEFGYLVLYFHLAITKVENRKRIRIGFVSGRGRPESIMYFNELQEYLSNERYELLPIEKDQLFTDFENLDYLISTYPLPNETQIPHYCIESDTYLEEIRMRLNDILYKTLSFDTYFQPVYSCMNLAGNTKAEVLSNFYHMFYERGYLKSIPDQTDRFHDDELGNGIVHLQDSHCICRAAMCFVAVLKRPVLWEQDLIKVFIFTKTKRDGDKDLPALCRFVSAWANCLDKVEHLTTTKKYSVFLHDIKEE